MVEHQQVAIFIISFSLSGIPPLALGLFISFMAEVCFCVMALNGRIPLCRDCLSPKELLDAKVNSLSS